MPSPQHAGIFKLDNNLGSLTAYTNEAIMVTQKRGLNSNSYHTLGSRDEKTTVGGRVQEVTVEAEYNKGTSSLYEIVRLWYAAPDTDKTVDIGFPDSSTGADTLVGEFKLTDFTPPDLKAGSGDPMKFKFTMKPNGTITDAKVV